MGERVVVSSPLIICQTLIHFQLQSYGVEKLDSKNTKDDEDLTLHFLTIVLTPDSQNPAPRYYKDRRAFSLDFLISIVSGITNSQ